MSEDKYKDKRKLGRIYSGYIFLARNGFSPALPEIEVMQILHKLTLKILKQIPLTMESKFYFAKQNQNS